MGKEEHLCIGVEPFTALFWALGIILANTWPCPPARHHSTAIHKACPYIVLVGSILSEDALPPFLILYYLSMPGPNLSWWCKLIYSSVSIHNTLFTKNERFYWSNSKDANTECTVLWWWTCETPTWVEKCWEFSEITDKYNILYRYFWLVIRHVYCILQIHENYKRKKIILSNCLANFDITKKNFNTFLQILWTCSRK